MEPIAAVLLAAVIALPFHLLVRHELQKLADPKHLRSQGVVLPSPELLQSHEKSIGTYMGQSIWERVTYDGTTYRFDRVAPGTYRKRLESDELFLEPGLVYVTA